MARSVCCGLGLGYDRQSRRSPIVVRRGCLGFDRLRASMDVLEILGQFSLGEGATE
jgi:hypothetical protein